MPDRFLMKEEKMKMKIILMSDSHDNKDAMDYVRRCYKDADLFVHCGDCLLPSFSPRMKGFLTVAGNMDKTLGYPEEETLEQGPFRILITHSDQVLQGEKPDYKALARYAKERGFNTVFFGHTHTYCDRSEDGVRLLNPGSVWKSRDGSPTTLMEIELTDTDLITKKVLMSDVMIRALSA